MIIKNKFKNFKFSLSNEIIRYKTNPCKSNNNCKKKKKTKSLKILH